MRTYELSIERCFYHLLIRSATFVRQRDIFWTNQISDEIEIISGDEDPSTSPPIVPTTSPPSDDFYDGCGTAKTCFGIGDGNCVNNRRCNTIGAVIYKAGNFVFEMRSSSKF